MTRAPSLPFALALLLAGAIAAAAPAPSRPSRPSRPTLPADPHERAHLAAGEVLVRLEKRPGGGLKEGIGTGVIEASPERVFRALTDYAHWEEFVPYLERSDARLLPDGAVESAQLLELPAPMGDRTLSIRARAAVEGAPAARLWTVRWEKVPGSGNVVDHYGSWALVELTPGRTLAVCHLYTNPGGFLSGLMDRATAKSLSWLFDGLRQQVRRSRYDAP